MCSRHSGGRSLTSSAPRGSLWTMTAVRAGHICRKPAYEPRQAGRAVHGASHGPARTQGCPARFWSVLRSVGIGGQFPRTELGLLQPAVLGMGAMGWYDPLRTTFASGSSARLREGRQAASRSGVGASTVVEWVRRLRRLTASAPARWEVTRRKKLSGSWGSWLLDRCRAGDLILRGSAGRIGRAWPEGRLSLGVGVCPR